MASDIFRNIVERKIDVFVSTFGNDANHLFKIDDKLIHPLEYGEYRERCAKELIGLTCDKSIAISDGFLISSKNNISKQCDIIMYDSYTLPLISNGITNFFPVEIVHAIGEVKSTLNKSDFKDALIKMSNNKKMFTERVCASGEDEDFNILNERDAFISFLICNNLNFDISEVDFDDIYRDVDVKYRHNMILSLQDGLFLYEFDPDKAPDIEKKAFYKKVKEVSPCVWFFPHSTCNGEVYKCNTKVINADESNAYEHMS